MNRFESVAGETTSHPTKQPAEELLAGHPKNVCQAVGYSHLMWLMALLLSAFVAGCSGGGGGGEATAGLAPTLNVVAPLPNAIGVPINTKVITAAFTKVMDPATLTPASFTLACPAGTPITGAVTYLAASNLAILTFPAATNLPPNTLCTATVTTGAKDTTGISLASNFVWTFTTAATTDATAPTVTGTIHANGATNVPINTQAGATFSEGMDPATITNMNFTLKETVSGAAVAGTVSYTGVTAVFKPASHLAASTTYTATITTGAKSAEGNALASDFVWSWTTAATLDTIAPTVTGTIHANGATNVAINTKVGVTFSEGMNPLTITNVNLTLKETATGTAIAGVMSYSGVSAVFIPLSNLAPTTTYTVTVKGGVSGVKSLEGNPLASDFTISWTTGASADTTAPMVTHTIRANGATNVPINTQASATFTEGMDPLTITNMTFTLKETVSGAAVAGIVSYSGVSAVFIPLSNLAPTTTYTVTIKGGVSGAKDMTGNPLASDFVWSWTTAATLDTIAPTVTGTIHANGATNVPINTKVGATFTEGMNPLTITNVTFTLKETVSGAAVAGIVSYSGVSAVFIPLSNLAPTTTYTVTVKGGVSGAKDLTGNPLASDFTISWTTGASADTTAPMVTHTIRANGATNVPINTKVGATFTEGMDPLTITNMTFTLKETASGAAVAGIVSYSGVNVVFIPLSNLAPTTTYTATVKSGVSGAKDLTGNPLASDFVWSWTTGASADTTAPTVTGVIYANGATNVPINTKVGATFSEGMDPLTITNMTFTLKETASGAAVAGIVSYSGVSAVFIPLSNLAPTTTYTVTIKGGASGAKSLEDNPLASDFVWSWTTGASADTTAPTVTGTIHANGATNATLNTKAGATFNKGMDPLTITNVNFTIKNTLTGVAVAGTVSYSGVNALFTVLNDYFGPSFEGFAPNTSYTATLKGGVGGVVDLAGNPLASDYVWSWTTGTTMDTVNPTVSSTAPQANAAGVAVNSAVNATFSEVMDPLTITTATFILFDGNTPVIGTVTYDMINNIAIFTPISPLAISTTYTAQVIELTDLAGNRLASGLAPIPWSFTTAATP